ncbi:MAG TPA: DNA-formamidopyrimidine glycosylase family protein [Acidimicrobiales bacterium]|nr:DNA-formamidopyrimidine glycosylase family protein [Acidimicrobiales bacterium]
MPELPEVESYRRLAAGTALDRPIASVLSPDAWYLKRGAVGEALTAALVDRRFVAARRRGKLMMLDTDDGTILGLRFGMSGRLLVDGAPGVDRLLYGRPATDPRHHRFTVVFDDGGSLIVSDPRRLGGVELDPDLSRLGPDALGVTLPELRAALAGSQTALKARLLDQSHLAGVGNLIADEVLWRAALSPLRPAGGLSPAALRRLHTHLTDGLEDLIRRGGSHTGDLMPHRRPGGLCPRDGTGLVRDTVGGRTTWWCPKHQR